MFLYSDSDSSSRIVNYCIMPEPSQPQGPITAAEHIGVKRAAEFARTGNAYALEHATRPSTIGFALASSPVALLSWYVLCAGKCEQHA